MTVDDRRDDIHAMIGSQGLLRRVHDDSLEPTTRPPEVIVTTSGNPPAPEPGDPTGYDAYKSACRELAHVWFHGMTAIGARILPPYVAEGRTPWPHEADQATRALLPWLDELAKLRGGERANGRGARHRGGVLLAIKRARETLDAAAGATCVAAPAPECRTPGCSGEQQHGYYCHACVKHQQRYGQLPDRVA